MSLTPSSMMPLGSIAPDFNLLNVVTQQKNSLSNLKGQKATVIIFSCNHCPFVKLILDQLVQTAHSFKNKAIEFIMISANDIDNFPEDSPEKMAELAQSKSFGFPYLYDESQEIAKKYNATCTPDFFVFDKDLRCVYRGRFDEATPGNGVPVTGQDLTNALNAILKGESPELIQYPSMGCNIKWKEK